MRKSEIKEGRNYYCKVSGKKTVVRVDRIRTHQKPGYQRATTEYCGVNLKTGREVRVKSAAKFTGEAEEEALSGSLTASEGSTADHTRPLLNASENGSQSLESDSGSFGSRIRATRQSAPHLIIEARAGTGKTTTLVEGLRAVQGITSTLEPSAQQAAVWEAMAKSKNPRSICFVAFNKSIATELQNRVPEGVDAMTMHSMGFKAVRKTFKLTNKKTVNGWKVKNIIEEVTRKDLKDLDPTLVKATDALVGLCKMNLREGTAEDLDELSSHYDIEMNGQRFMVYELVPQILEICKKPEQHGYIDFNDMIWLPVVHQLPLWKYDLLLVDEAQDLNACQQELATMAGRRLILCGDPKQAIYGFAGADSRSMERMLNRLSETKAGCDHLYLTETRRCGKAIVSEAQRLVPDFSAHESNPEGKVSGASFPYPEKPDQPTYRELVEDGDMVICRVNAPLVRECFWFLRVGRKANIQGRDIGKGLTNLIKKMKAGDVEELLQKLDHWTHKEVNKENAKKNPSEARIIALQDKQECIICFTEDAQTVEQVISKIESVFSDDNHKGIKLSSGHRAKGLEASRVFYLQPKGAEVPHPMAKSEWQCEQEFNVDYVIRTRAINELVYVR